MLRIIDNKKINLTDSEFNLYTQIVKAYTTSKFKGEDLFKDLFETDENGTIIFLKPPKTTHSTMEVFLSVTSVMVHQHLRISATASDLMIAEAKECLNEIKVKKIEERLSLLEEKMKDKNNE